MFKPHATTVAEIGFLVQLLLPAHFLLAENKAQQLIFGQSYCHFLTISNFFKDF